MSIPHTGAHRPGHLLIPSTNRSVSLPVGLQSRTAARGVLAAGAVPPLAKHSTPRRSGLLTPTSPEDPDGSLSSLASDTSFNQAPFPKFDLFSPGSLSASPGSATEMTRRDSPLSPGKGDAIRRHLGYVFHLMRQFPPHAILELPDGEQPGVDLAGLLKEYERRLFVCVPGLRRTVSGTQVPDLGRTGEVPVYDARRGNRRGRVYGYVPRVITGISGRAAAPSDPDDPFGNNFQRGVSARQTYSEWSSRSPTNTDISHGSRLSYSPQGRGGANRRSGGGEAYHMNTNQPPPPPTVPSYAPYPFPSGMPAHPHPSYALPDPQPAHGPWGPPIPAQPPLPPVAHPAEPPARGYMDRGVFYPHQHTYFEPRTYFPLADMHWPSAAVPTADPGATGYAPRPFALPPPPPPPPPPAASFPPFNSSYMGGDGWYYNGNAGYSGQA